MQYLIGVFLGFHLSITSSITPFSLITKVFEEYPYIFFQTFAFRPKPQTSQQWHDLVNQQIERQVVLGNKFLVFLRFIRTNPIHGITVFDQMS